MKKILLIFSFLLALLPLSACNELAVENNDTNATVERVIDGDTLKLEMDGEIIRVRLSDVDTPETVHPNKEKQKFGEEASQFTKNLLPVGTKVKLEYVDGETEDQYGRHLGMLWVDGKMVNELLVEEGLARVNYYHAKDSDKYTSRLEKAEESAKQAKKNIWSIDGYVTKKGYNTNAY